MKEENRQHAKSDMDRFIDRLMGKMTLARKIGQLNHPNVGGADTTGAAAGVDIKERLRRGEVGTISGDSFEQRRALQELAVNEGPDGIPLAFALDVIHGYKTIFPIPLALSCSWDMALVERTARAAANEAATEGVSITWGPMVDISRDARWGRVAEGAGEDPYMGAQVAAAMVRGFQGGDLSAPGSVMAVAKHFAGYGFVKSGRDYNTVDVSAYKMHNVILPPFKAAVDAGVGGVMTAFNDISGIPATAHRELLEGLLRKKLGFGGVLATDYTAVEELVNHGVAENLKEATFLAARAGITTDLVSEAFLRHLETLVREGRIGEDVVDVACRRVLEMKYKLGLFDDPYRHFDADKAKTTIMSPENRALAREAAVKSCVLLKNAGGVLPLRKDARIALVGPLAGGDDARANMQGTWAISADPRNNVTVEEGLAGKGVQVVHARGANIVDDPNIAARLNVHNPDYPAVVIDGRSPDDMIAEAVAAAEHADAIVACVGEAKEHSGEAAMRTELGLPGSQRKLLEALKKTGKPLILVTMSGRPLALEWENENADAILHAWFGGAEAGNAIADLLFGDRDPSGRLTMSFPRSAGQCPLSYAEPPTGRPRDKIGVDVRGDGEKCPAGMNVFRKFTTACRIEGPHTPLFPFGYGLSYTSFACGPVKVNKEKLSGSRDVLRASVTVRNTGARAGEETVQLYISDPVASMARPAKELKGFRKVHLLPGEEKEVTFEITPEDLSFCKSRGMASYRRVWEEGAFIVRIGASSEDLQSADVYWSKSSKRSRRNDRGARL